MIKIVCVILNLILLARSISGACKPKEVEYNNDCYYYKTFKPWNHDVGVQLCKRILKTDGLAPAKNMDQLNFLHSLYPKAHIFGGASYMVLGAKRINGVYMWEDGTPVTWTNWAPPQWQYTDDDCIVSSLSSKLWYFAPCDYPYENDYQYAFFAVCITKQKQ